MGARRFVRSRAPWPDDRGVHRGHLTVAVIAISAILTLIMTLRPPRRVAGDEPHQDHHSRSLTIA
jgi:hypothetical protein